MRKRFHLDYDVYLGKLVRFQQEECVLGEGVEWLLCVVMCVLVRGLECQSCS